MILGLPNDIYLNLISLLQVFLLEFIDSMNPLYPDNNKDNNHIVKYHPGKQCKFTFDINKVIIKPSDEEFKQGIEVTSSKNYLH